MIFVEREQVMYCLEDRRIVVDVECRRGIARY